MSHQSSWKKLSHLKLLRLEEHFPPWINYSMQSALYMNHIELSLKVQKGIFLTFTA